MRPLSRILISSSACALLLAPALLAGSDAKRSGASVHSGAAATLGDSGFGAGMWIPATNTPGFVSARLYDGEANLRYALRANLVPGQLPPPGMDQQGGFLGVLLAVDARGAKSVRAQVSGKWILHPNGWGEFDVDVLVPTGDKNQPLVSIGAIQGSMLPPGIMPSPDAGDVDTVAGQKDQAAESGEVVLMWSIPAEGLP